MVHKKSFHCHHILKLCLDALHAYAFRTYIADKRKPIKWRAKYMFLVRVKKKYLYFINDARLCVSLEEIFILHYCAR